MDALIFNSFELWKKKLWKGQKEQSSYNQIGHKKEKKKQK